MTDRYDVLTPRPGKEKTYWLKIGMMVPSKDGAGFSLKLDALPLPDRDGNIWLKISPPREEDRR